MAKVQIKIKSVSSFQGTGDDIMEGCYMGDLSLRENGFCFSYGEQDNPELDATLTLTGNGAKVTLERTNTNPWLTHFEEGKEDHSQYNTPYGSIPAVVKAEKVSYDISTLGGTLHLVYSLNFQGVSQGKVNYTAELEVQK